MEIDQINSNLFSGKLPAWFDPDAGLPKYSLPQEALKAVKNQEDNARLHAKFLKALDDCLKDSAVGSLFNKGVEGYSIMGGIGRPRDLYSKAMQKLGNSGYVGKFETDACLRLTALLILNQRKLLPETFENEKQAIRECRKYVETQTVPAWFVEGMTLPEIR